MKNKILASFLLFSVFFMNYKCIDQNPEKSLVDAIGQIYLDVNKMTGKYNTKFFNKIIETNSTHFKYNMIVVSNDSIIDLMQKSLEKFCFENKTVSCTNNMEDCIVLKNPKYNSKENLLFIDIDIKYNQTARYLIDTKSIPFKIKNVFHYLFTIDSKLINVDSTSKKDVIMDIDSLPVKDINNLKK